MKENAIEISGLKKSYDNTLALQEVNLSIKKGEFFGLLGPNGAGKTTTISILTGLVFRDEGSTLVFGEDTVENFRYTRSKIGIAAQELSVDWFFSIEKLLYFQAGYYGLSKKDAKESVNSLLERLGLDKKRSSRLRQLSGGMKRRFQLAKALVHDPDIIILDEPTAGVDVELRRSLWKYLNELHSEGKTILLTTHYIEEAEQLCENIAIIDEGKILKRGSPKELTQELGSSGITIKIGDTINKFDSFLSDYSYTFSDNRLHFSVKNPDVAMPDIIQKLSKNNIKIQSVESNSSSLEDVFLDLTGKGIDE
ncbi:MAG: ATP-binding cassette domain-containing protein [Candidatus Neomarinimicrobiota bacterium]